ncbi:hypothetical protein JIG36_51120 [Actinoplanes sp. LDG1-06]|uniref:Uncharacterized protein n=1 Tax=Paractinoplanes ovalisporus TaxID=2810368 RepID=A0ABS2AXB6_9ACTN|nr:hypothetical protein [Actinoplanes ovalisporus]MBM2623871.1 hypothetical protein [Actinoplanes ovalisporus]
MSVLLRQVLPPEAGRRLPAPAREALVQLGVACNTAAAAVNRASLFEDEAIANAQHLEATGGNAPAIAVVDDLAAIADQFHEHTLIALARAATPYAVYASHVATQVAACKPAPPPGSEVIKPSDVITAAGLYLPLVEFSTEHGDARVVTDQNAAIRRSHRDLDDVITFQLQGHDVSLFDELRLPDTRESTIGIPDAFPFALYDYAATLTWAVGVFTGVEEV